MMLNNFWPKDMPKLKSLKMFISWWKISKEGDEFEWDEIHEFGRIYYFNRITKITLNSIPKVYPKDVSVTEKEFQIFNWLELDHHCIEIINNLNIDDTIDQILYKKLIGLKANWPKMKSKCLPVSLQNVVKK